MCVEINIIVQNYSDVDIEMEAGEMWIKDRSEYLFRVPGFISLFIDHSYTNIIMTNLIFNLCKIIGKHDKKFYSKQIC